MKKTTFYFPLVQMLFFLVLFGPMYGQLSVSVTYTNVTCNGGSNGVATAVPSGGTGHYSYSWSPSGGTGATASGLGANTYTLTLRDTVSSALQTYTLYTQDFEGTHGWTLNVVTGTQGADPNFWTVSDNEGGVLPPGCGVATNGNKTLHVTSVFNPSGGASYDAGGLCGFLFCPQACSRSQSPAFSTLTYSATKLEFDFIANGDALNDNASVWYNSGSGWTLLTSSIKSTTCGGGQGQWTHYSASLPASCDNNAAVQVGINWINNDDGVGTDPSVAINNVLITGKAAVAPVVQTVTATVTVSEPAPITGSQTVALCQGQTLVVGTSTYTTAGTYTNVLTAMNGCDSTLTTNLSFNSAIDTSTSVAGSTITSNANSGTYQWVDCGNAYAAIPGETNQSFVAGTNGSYAVVITQNSCSDTSACVKINSMGMELSNQLRSDFLIYPNPANDQLTVENKLGVTMEIGIYDQAGRLLQASAELTKAKFDIAQLKDGVYTVSIKCPSGTVFKKLIVIH